MPVDAKNVNIVFIALLVAGAILGIASIPGTTWSGFVHPVILFLIFFLGILLLGWILNNAAENALGGSPRRRK